MQLKKRILRTVLNEIIVQSERESRTLGSSFTGLEVFIPNYPWSAIHRVNIGVKRSEPSLT